MTSAHKDFCAGADLDKIYQMRDPGALYAAVMQMHQLYRGFETAGVPVVAALNGTALGGGRHSSNFNGYLLPKSPMPRTIWMDVMMVFVVFYFPRKPPKMEVILLLPI